MPSFEAPTIAVIIPNYNYGHFISKAVESVLSQSVPFDEIIIVDDGSIDNSLSVIEQYKSRATIIAQKNGGQLCACINGIRACKSDYVYILDADDWVAADMLERLKPALSEKPAKVQFQLRVTDAGENFTGSVIPGFPSDYSQAKILQDNKVIGFYICPPTSGNVYRKDVLEKLPLERLNGREFSDGTPTLAIPYFGEIVTLRQPLAYYRVHNQNVSQALEISETVLLKEMDRFSSRWKEMEEVIGIKYVPLGRTPAFFLSERKLMIAALRNRWFCFQEVTDFVRGLWKTSYSVQQKSLFTLWALTLLIPVRPLRKAVIAYRRLGVSRPRWISTTVAWINGRR